MLSRRNPQLNAHGELRAACTLWDPFNDRMSGDSRNIGR